MKQFFLLVAFLPTLLIAQLNGRFYVQPVFEENAGQVIFKNKASENPQIRFVLRGSDLTYYFSDRGYSVIQKDSVGTINRTDFFFQHDRTCFVPAVTKIIPEGENEIASKNFYYLSASSFSARKFEKIIYRNVTNETDFEFSIHNGNLERKLIIHHPNHLKVIPTFDVRGSVVGPRADGGYDFSSSVGVFNETVAGGNERIHYGNHELNSFNGGEQRLPGYWLRLIGSDQTQASSISWLTYVGGNNSDELLGITLAADSGVVVVGRTSSVDFPSTPGSYQDTFNLDFDAVVTRFDKYGNCLWSTFYGGINFDGAYQAITLDSTFVIAGMSNSANLPMQNPTQATNAGSYDAFLLTLNLSGQLVRSTYYGGSGGDMGLAIAKGPLGEIVLAGSTSSSNLPFTSGGFQNSLGGAIDAFLTVFDDSLNVQWSTYYGGNGSEDIHAITVTPQGEIAFVGGTRSFNFSVTPNAWQSGLLNQPDNYLVKFAMNGSRLYATFFGGTNNEDANGIVSDNAGNLYMTGFTYSADFPIQGTSFQTTLMGQEDVFVSKFDTAGQLVWSTFVGGGGQDVAWGICGMGKYIFIAGQTDSPTFPVSPNGIQPILGLNGDAFVFKMDTAGQMISGTFMGGNGVDAILAITVDSDTNVIACGDAYSTDLAVTPGAFQMTNASNGDGFVVKFGMAEELITTVVNHITEINSISVFPNPSNGLITISNENESISKIELLDMSGRLLKSLSVNTHQAILDISEYPKGIYLLNVTNESSQSIILKLVKN